ncbi:MAG: hypothetical protein LUG49_05225 [Oscillospiraceae bacterium]|nr:hypothetical protein [Oscillospiraceae bacterium]
MTKKLFILFLTLCLAVVGMTVVAMADALDSIQIAGIDLASGQYVDSGVVQVDSVQTGDPTSGSGYAYYLNGTLYLNNFTVDAGYVYAIFAYGDLTIEISGTNSISSNLGAISLSGNLSITGSGCLTAKGGIYSNSGITVTPSTGGILEVTVGSTTSYYSEATSLGTSLSGTVTIKPHTHSYVNNECVCGAKDYGTVNIGNATLKDGQYALVDGYNMSVYDGTPSGTSYAYFSGGVLYLNNFSCGSYSSNGISCYNDLTINLTGTNSITGTGIVVSGSLSIGGTGSLTVTTEDYGYAAILANGDITFKGVTIDVTSNEGFAIAIETQGSVIISGSDVTLSSSVTNSGDAAMTIYAYVDIVIENGSTLTATASFAGEKGIARTLYAINSISITDSTVTKIEASGYAGHAMYAQMGAITITNSTVNASATATADEYAPNGYDGRAIYASAGDVTITKSTVTATSTGVTYAYDIYASEDVSISGSDVTTTATASGTGSEASAIFAYGGSIDITESEVVAEASAYKIDGAILTYSADKDITITDSDVTATSTSGVYRDNGGAIATYDTGSDIIISGSKITANSISNSTTRKNFGAISAMGSVNVSESELELKSTGGYVYGTLHAEENITVTDSELVATADGIVAYAMVAIDGEIDISGSNVSATATGTTAQSAIYVTDGDIILTPGTGEALEVTLGTNNPVYYYSETTVEDNGWSSYGYVKIAVSNHTHSYTPSVTTEATCTTDGVMTYTCACGDSYTESIPATGHDYEETVTEPTCTEGGYTTYTCSNCGDTYTADETEALGHSYVYQGFAWSGDLKSATATFECSACGDVQVVDATVTSRNVLGVVTRVATVEFGGASYNSDPVTTGTSLLIIGTLTQTESEEVDSEEVDSEEVEITEPIEDSNTESEPEEEATEPEPETNPTTGAVVAMLPVTMAIAAFAAGKKRIG